MGEFLPVIIVLVMMVVCLLIPARWDPAMRLKKWSERDED